MKNMLLVFVLLGPFFHATHGVSPSTPSSSNNDKAFAGSKLKRFSSVVAESEAERPQQEVATESETLQSILSSRKTTYHSLSDLRSYRSWDFSWPTLTRPHRFTPRHTYASDKAFFAAIQTHNKGLTFDLLTAVGAFDERNSVVLYGGALVDIVTKQEDSIRDWDLRLIGEEYTQSPQKCLEAAKQFTRNVFAFLKKENERIVIKNQELKRKERGRYEETLFDIQAVKITRSQSTITVIVPGRGMTHKETILQFTFAPYASVEDMLAGCLPHCTRLAVKDNEVVLDAAAKYCLESLCIVFDTDSFKHLFCGTDETNDKSARPLSVEIARSIKYFEKKGFDIILPNLDIKKLPTRNLEFNQKEVLDLPIMTVIFDGYEGNKIMASHVALAGTSRHLFEAEPHGYDPKIDFDAAKFIHHNIRCLVADVYDKFTFWAEGEVVDPVFDYAPLLTGRMVDKAYEALKKNALSSGSIQVNKVCLWTWFVEPRLLDATMIYTSCFLSLI